MKGFKNIHTAVEKLPLNFYLSVFQKRKTTPAREIGVQTIEKYTHFTLTDIADIQSR